MKLCYLGPVERRELLQSWCSPGVTLEAREPEGPAALNNLADEYLSVPGDIEAALQAERDGFSAVILSCFGDPSLPAVREALRVPVAGLGESSLFAAMAMGELIGIVTPLPELVAPTRRQVRVMGIQDRLAAIVPLGLRVETIRREPARAKTALARAVRELAEAHGAGVVVPGCGSLGLYADEVGRGSPVPVVNPLRAGVRMAEFLAGLRGQESR